MSDIIIPDKPKLEKKIEAIRKEGASSLHVLSDFDRTLTKAFFKEEKIPSLISHLRNGHYLTKDYAEKAQTLFNKYHPIELSDKITKEEKSKAMLEWWSAHYKLLVKSGLNEKTIKQALKDIIQEGKIKLRKGAAEFLQKLNQDNIPLIILSSAGIGNMVTEFLKEQNLMFNNIHFIGNTLKFDKAGNFAGIKDNKIIHVLNKHEAEIKNLPIYEEIKQRKNIILLGDSIDDLGLAQGVQHKNIIKIGFLNFSEQSLEEFQKNFDVIIMNDGDFSEINNVLSKILE